MSRHPGIIASAGAFVPPPAGYASLGTIILEYADITGTSSPAYPFNTGVALPAVGTLGFRGRFADVTDTFQTVFGAGARNTTERGVAVHTNTTAQLQARLHNGDGTSQAIRTTANNNIVNNVLVTCIVCWDATTLLVRVGANEYTTAHGKGAAIGGLSIWIGTNQGQGTWHAANGCVFPKLVGYSAFLDATNRAALQSLLDAET